MLRNYFKFQPFSSKIARIKLLWSNLIKLAGSAHPKDTNTIFTNYKGASLTSISIKSVLECRLVVYLLPYLDDYP